MQIQLNIIQQTFGVNSELTIPDFNYSLDLLEVPEILEIPEIPEIQNVPEYIPIIREFTAYFDLA